MGSLQRNIKELESSHTRHLHIILRIKWQDMIPNTEVLKSAQTNRIEAYLIKAQLRWTGHVLRMEDGRLPKGLLYGELGGGVSSRSIEGQRKRFKDTLKRSLSVCNIDTDKWESTGQDRIQWRNSVQDGSNVFENERVATAEEKRKKYISNPIATTIGTGHHRSHVYRVWSSLHSPHWTSEPHEDTYTKMITV